MPGKPHKSSRSGDAGPVTPAVTSGSEGNDRNNNKQFSSAVTGQPGRIAIPYWHGRGEEPIPTDPITELVQLAGAHPDPAVRELAERLPDPRVRAVLGCIGDLAERIAARDRLLRQVGDAIAGQSTSRRAEMIAAMIARYQASGAWRVDRRSPVNPHPSGSRNAVLWDTLRLVDRTLSARQLRKILASHQR